MRKTKEAADYNQPLAKLIQHGLHQEPLFSQARPRNPSRFSLPRIAFTLRRKVEEIKFFRRNGTVGNGIRIQGEAAEAPETTVMWTEDREKTLTVTFTLPGATKMLVDNGKLIFQTDKGIDGPSVTLSPTGGFLATPLPTRRTQLAQEQASLPWWQQSAEVIKDQLIEFDAKVGADPDFGPSTKNNTPYGHFPIEVEGTEKQFDVFAYQEGIALLKRRKLHTGDLIHLRAAVKIDRQFAAKNETTERRWLRFFDTTKLPKSNSR